ncbi:MAG TPA: peptidoglycan glycosyltransferase [Clostridiales bacterium]|nr:peptidoglycan glycosyltransferase [Clostridiales bacterium]
MKTRTLWILGFFAFTVLLLCGRLFWLQVVKGDGLRQAAYEQQNADRFISPARGAIYDRNGKELAVSVSVETITASPITVKSSDVSLEFIASELAVMFDLDEEKLLSKLNQNVQYIIIARKVDIEKGDELRAWLKKYKVSGIYINEDTKRYYPLKNLASQVIGFTGADNQGLEGIEAVMDRYLKGIPGKILSEIDANGLELPFSTETKINAQDGFNVVLTIDETIQYMADKALEKALVDNNCIDGGSVIIMDPRNADILAMVSKPDFDLNQPFAVPPGQDASTWKGTTAEDTEILRSTVWRNKTIMDTYEPGSTFKSFTTAMGYEENVVHDHDSVVCQPVTVLGKTMNCWKRPPHGTETFREGVYNSCNPVFVNLALKIGVDKFYNYISAFGFRRKTGIDLPGEQLGLFHTQPTALDMSVASFGQRFTVTPIQMITAFSSLANGGTLLKPKIVKELTDQDGNIVKQYETEAVRDVVSVETCERIRDILEGVVSEGTGRNAKVAGYNVAGKTGTSQTTEEGHYIASFLAMAPADNPVICVLVILDNPKGPYYYGGTIAAPVAGEIAEDVLTYLKIKRREEGEVKKDVVVPDVRNMTVAQAKSTLKEYGLKALLNQGVDENKAVTKQSPLPNITVPEGSLVMLYEEGRETVETVTMPNLLNLDELDVAETAEALGLNIRISGTGNAIFQSVSPGEKVEKGSVIEVSFRYMDKVE